jgi:23S rRNA pseudouridine1911/1915/1917 synthase
LEREQLVSFEVSDIDGKERIDRYLARLLPELSRQRIQKLIKNERCQLNDELCSSGSSVKNGDIIHLSLDEPAEDRVLEPAPLDIDVLYEDEDLIVVNKAAGVVVHPGIGTIETTLIEGILYHLQKGRGDLPGPTDRPGIVHRLDKDTSGVMVVAKHARSHASLAEQFKEKTNLREYVALLDGVLKDTEITVESHLTRDPRQRLRFKSIPLGEKAPNSARYAKSIFKKRMVFGKRLTLVNVRLSTGRTHQIRAHARSLNAPVWGDPVYGRQKPLPLGCCLAQSSESLRR